MQVLEPQITRALVVTAGYVSGFSIFFARVRILPVGYFRRILEYATYFIPPQVEHALPYLYPAPFIAEWLVVE
jgi:hypothetical protein